MAEITDAILALYRLHAELADGVSQRRDSANRLFVGLVTGLLALGAALLRFGTGEMDPDLVTIFVSIAGILLCVAWYFVIRSYRQLSTGKFAALHELEKMLPYRFFEREWELLGEGRDRSRYWRLTVVETLLPVVFSLLFVALLLAAVIG